MPLTTTLSWDHEYGTCDGCHSEAELWILLPGGVRSPTMPRYCAGCRDELVTQTLVEHYTHRQPIHRRTSKSQIAYCGAPAKQEHLRDDVEDVNCPGCWSAMRASVMA